MRPVLRLASLTALLIGVASPACGYLFGLDDPRIRADAYQVADADGTVDAEEVVPADTLSCDGPGGSCQSFPVLAGSARDAGTLDSPMQLSLPAGIQNQDLLIAFLNRGGGSGQTFTWPVGWSELVSEPVDPGSTYRCAVAYRWANGSEGAAIAVTSTSLASPEVTRWVVVRITGASGVEISAPAAGSGLAFDPPALASSQGVAPILWLAASFATNTNITTTVPSGYTSVMSYGSTRVAWVQRFAAIEDPGPIASDLSVGWRAYTLAVRP
jgi:hypothetical protein